MTIFRIGMARRTSLAERPPLATGAFFDRGRALSHIVKLAMKFWPAEAGLECIALLHVAEIPVGVDPELISKDVALRRYSWERIVIIQVFGEDRGVQAQRSTIA
jgi:hypothetical protein